MKVVDKKDYSYVSVQISILMAGCLKFLDFFGLEYYSLKAEIVEMTFGFPKLGRIIVISLLFYFRILVSFLVVSLNDCHFLELAFVSGAD